MDTDVLVSEHYNLKGRIKMTHDEVYQTYRDTLPFYAKRTTEWFPNGYDSVRVRVENQGEFVFTCLAGEGFKFEDIDTFIKSMKGA